VNQKPTRIYVVIDTKSPTRWLVRAINPHVAKARIVRERFVARVASQDELIRLTAKGVGVIDTSTDDIVEPDFFPSEIEEEPSLP
jgi:hypothetical protein